jgi:hypothetical protein
VLLLSSDDDGEMALLELRYGRAAIHPPSRWWRDDDGRVGPAGSRLYVVPSNLPFPGVNGSFPWALTSPAAGHKTLSVSSRRRTKCLVRMVLSQLCLVALTYKLVSMKGKWLKQL